VKVLQNVDVHRPDVVFVFRKQMPANNPENQTGILADKLVPRINGFGLNATYEFEIVGGLGWFDSAVPAWV